MKNAATHIVISGIPGTGKTTLANYLAEHHGYYHLDMEAKAFLGRQRIKHDPEELFTELSNHPKVVVSWGFGPFEDRRDIERFIASGYRVAWLDGDRVAAFRNFMSREQSSPNAEVMEYQYYGQMQLIMATNIVAQLEAIIIDPFDTQGNFRAEAEIAQELLARTKVPK